MKSLDKKQGGVWAPTTIQFLYKHRNGCYYARVYAGGKEKWTNLKCALDAIRLLLWTWR